MPTPGKNAPGLKGFPTPNEMPDTNGYLAFLFPNSNDWAGILLGAVQATISEYNWYEWGSMTPAEAAEAFRLIVEQAPLNILPLTVPTPYWDETSADDTDDEMTRAAQVWYGQIVETMGFVAEDAPTLSFLDNVGIWLIAGFIAYAGMPGAAIAFVPIARKFVLYFKQSPTGAIVNILADFLHLADIDTYGVEDGIASVSIVMPDDATTLYVEQAAESNPDAGDAPKMVVIRSRLSEADFSNPAYRYDATCDCIQYTPDGGTTWNDAPGNDPRHADAYRFPARGGMDIECQAAANANAWLKMVVDWITFALSTGSTIVAVVNKILVFAELIFGFVPGEFVNLILAIAGALFDVGSSALAAAFAGDEWPTMLCILFCAMDSAGQINGTRFAAMQSQVTGQLNATAGDVVNLLLSLTGEVGISNAGAQGTATADCSGCGNPGNVWSHFFDFSLSAQGFVPYNFGGAWAVGGFTAAYNGGFNAWRMAAARAFAMPSCSEVTGLQIQWVGGAQDYARILSIADSPSGANQQSCQDFSGSSMDSPYSCAVTYTDAGTFAVFFLIDASNSGRQATGFIISGTGTEPDWSF